MAQGADAVEIDVRLAADGTPVVIHDETFERLWSDPHPIGSLTWPEIARLGGPAERVPRLAEALELSIATGVPLVIDQKSPAAGLAAARLVDRISASRTAFCGSADGLLEIRALLPEATIFCNVERVEPLDPYLLAAMRPQYYNPYWLTVSPAMIRTLHSLGIAVCCWTPNDDGDLALVLDLGVDAVMTDRVGALGTLLDARGPYRESAKPAWPQAVSAATVSAATVSAATVSAATVAPDGTTPAPTAAAAARRSARHAPAPARADDHR